MTKVFLSPSDQNGNAVTGGGNEQQYAQLRCARAAEVLRAHGITVLVSERGKSNGNTGFLESLNEGNAWGPDIYVADHTNAANGRASGVQAYCYPEPNSQRLGACINARMDPIVPGGASIQDGSDLGEVNGSYATAVLMESGYHDNPTDAAVIRTKTTEMGEAIAYGILDYLGVTTNEGDNEMNQQQQATLDQTAAQVRAMWGWMGGGSTATEFYLIRQQLAQLQATTAAQAAAIQALATSQGVDPATITETVRTAVEAALDDISITLSTEGAAA